MSIVVPAPVALSGAALPIGTVPPGASTVVISCTGTGPAYIGTSSSVSATTGFPLPSGQTVTFPGFTTSAPTTLYAFSASATVGVIISTSR